MPGARTMRTCPVCRKYLAGATVCQKCAATRSGPTPTRAFAASLRTQATAVKASPQPSSSGGVLWGPVTGQVRREQETWLGRARGTTLVAVAGFMAPVMVGIATGATAVSTAVGGVVAMMMLLLLPIALLVLFMSLGRGGPFASLGRMAGNSAHVGMGLANNRTNRGRPGRILIIGNGSDECRVAVARPLDIPIGSTVTVHGPKLGGYRHAWLIQTHGLDSHALPTRGVILAFIAVALGGIFALLGLVGGIGGAIA